MKIKGIRHVGIHVKHYNFSNVMKFYQNMGGEVVQLNALDKRPDKDLDIMTCKIRFEDGSMIELTTDTNHIAFNVSEKPSRLNWDRDPSGLDLEMVLDE